MKSKKVNKENEEIAIEEQEVQSNEVQQEVSYEFEKGKIRRRIGILPIILSITGIIAVWIGA